MSSISLPYHDGVESCQCQNFCICYILYTPILLVHWSSVFEHLLTWCSLKFSCFNFLLRFGVKYKLKNMVFILSGPLDFEAVCVCVCVCVCACVRACVRARAPRKSFLSLHSLAGLKKNDGLFINTASGDRKFGNLNCKLDHTCLE
jgi:hypothetical protein